MQSGAMRFYDEFCYLSSLRSLRLFDLVVHMTSRIVQ